MYIHIDFFPRSFRIPFGMEKAILLHPTLEKGWSKLPFGRGAPFGRGFTPVKSGFCSTQPLKKVGPNFPSGGGLTGVYPREKWIFLHLFSFETPIFTNINL